MEKAKKCLMLVYLVIALIDIGLYDTVLSQEDYTNVKGLKYSKRHHRIYLTTSDSLEALPCHPTHTFSHRRVVAKDNNVEFYIFNHLQNKFKP